MASYDLTNPSNAYSYAQTQPGLQSNWGRQTAALNRQDARSADQYGFNMRSANRQFENARGMVGTNASRRGVFRSGIHQRMRDNFELDRQDRIGQLIRDFQTNREGYGMQQGQFDQGYFGGSLDARTQQSLGWADLAAALQDGA